MKENTTIFDAAEKNRLTAVKQFIELEEVYPNSTNHLGQNVAHIAASKGYLKMLKYLLSKDPDLLTVPDPWDATLLHLAVESGSLKTVKFLVEDYKADPRQDMPGDRFGDSSIHLAAEKGNLVIFKYFVEEQGVDVSLRNHLQQPPAFTAALHAHLDIIEYIVDERKADVTMIDSLGGTILFKSAKKGDVSVPKFLLDERKLNIDINHKDTFGETILHRAARLNRVNFVKYIVGEKRANLNIEDHAGKTPLHLAASLDNLTIVKLLVKYGADISAKDHFEKTPVQLAKIQRVVKYLEEVAKKRVRRSAPVSIVSAVPRSNAIPVVEKWIQGMVAIAGPSSVANRVNFVDIASHQVLTLARSCVGSRYQCGEDRTLLSPTEIVQNRIDPIAVDAVFKLLVK